MKSKPMDTRYVTKADTNNATYSTTMVIIWRGLGWLVAVIVFGFSLAANFVVNATYGEGYYDHHK
jgi:hypothetical protein